MGAAPSVMHADTKEHVKLFKEAVNWYAESLTNGQGNYKTDAEIEAYLASLKFVGNDDGGGGKEDGVRPAAETGTDRVNSDDTLPVGSPPDAAAAPVPSQEAVFEDSTYNAQWLSPAEADALFAHLKEVGEKQRPRNAAGEPASMKYPLWTIYYGMKREKDGAIALDRWGSYHESWIRVEEPSPEVARCCEKLREFQGLPASDVNSIVVNYYFDGDTTYIPAHRDTVACLKEGSSIYCLSLGASRSFCLVDNSNSGGYIKEEMDVKKEWVVRHGDLFALGQRTNELYCHAVPKEPALKSMRISVIFRTVDKSFVKFGAEPKMATYATGKSKVFTAECVTAKGFDDTGIVEHVADLVAHREELKRKKMEKAREVKAAKEAEAAATAQQTPSETDSESGSATSSKPNKAAKEAKAAKDAQDTKALKLLHLEDDKKFFMGAGLTVPKRGSHNSLIDLDV